MASEVLVDTSGFYALLVRGDDRHAEAVEWLRGARRRRRGFVTTDYVLDETLTLLRARGKSHLVEGFIKGTLDSMVCRVLWTDVDRFTAVVKLFMRQADHDWSFTDCLSFHVMRELEVREALTKDVHFVQAGFVALLR